MIAVHILIEVVMVIGITIASHTVWEIRRRMNFLAHALTKENALEHHITKHLLESLPEGVTVFAEKGDFGYPENLRAVIEADSLSQWRTAFSLAAVAVIALAVTAFLGIGYFVVGLVFLLIPGYGSVGAISEAAQQSVLTQIETVALIMHRWRRESPPECEKWVSANPEYALVYRAVSLAS